MAVGSYCHAVLPPPQANDSETETETDVPRHRARRGQGGVGALAPAQAELLAGQARVSALLLPAGQVGGTAQGLLAGQGRMPAAHL